MPEQPCGTDKAPEGWWCAREKGHEGPCAVWTRGTTIRYRVEGGAPPLTVTEDDFEEYIQREADAAHSDTPKGRMGRRKTVADMQSDPELRAAFEAGMEAGRKADKATAKAVLNNTARSMAAEAERDKYRTALEELIRKLDPKPRDGNTQSAPSRIFQALHIAREALK